MFTTSVRSAAVVTVDLAALSVHHMDPGLIAMPP